MISLVVGLGNVGPEYVGTRHNVGFEAVNRAARLLEASRRIAHPLYESALVKVIDPTEGDRRVLLAWPGIYMNRSGIAVRNLLQQLQIGPESALVVVDDFNLPLGTLRFREQGSDGGHLGLASIIEELGTDSFPRLRLGIGAPADEEDIPRYVLSRFEIGELLPVETMLAKAAEAIIFALTHRLEEAMSQFNSGPALPDEA